MVSIHGPLGYGPSTLPLRHSATDNLPCKMTSINTEEPSLQIISVYVIIMYANSAPHHVQQIIQKTIVGQVLCRIVATN